MLRPILLGASALLIALTLVAAARAEESGGPPHDTDRSIESPGLVAGGAALTTVGLAAIPIGTLVGVLGNAQVVCSAHGPCDTPHTGRATAAAASLIIGGSLALGGGVTMMVFGSQAEDDVTVAIGPGNLAFTGRF
jgi:hypothetical protein